MTLRPLLQWPDKRLRQPSAPVDAITDQIRAIWAEMVKIMDKMPGVGLAAPQIGEMLQLAVVDASEARDRRILLANPSILSASSEEVLGQEASPNLPGASAQIKRAKSVTVRYLNQEGIVDRREFHGMEARSVQHQIDHLAGRMYFDRLSRVKRDMLLRKAIKGRR